MPRLNAAQPIVFKDGTMQNLFRDFLLRLERDKLGDAPSSGLSYVRSSGEWVEAAPRSNLIINGDFIINQRGGTRTPGIGVYGFDRWKGHASGLEQVVEYNGPTSDVTLSWVGGGTGSLNGVTGTSPITGSVSASTNFSVIVPSNASQVQCSLGSIPSPFEYRDIADELARCQRYYQELSVEIWRPLGIFRGAGTTRAYSAPVHLPAPMRETPTASGQINTVSIYDVHSSTVTSLGDDGQVIARGISPKTVEYELLPHASIATPAFYVLATRGNKGPLKLDAEL